MNAESSTLRHIEACRGAVLVIVTSLLVGGTLSLDAPLLPTEEANYIPCHLRKAPLKSLLGETVYIYNVN